MVVSIEEEGSGEGEEVCLISSISISTVGFLKGVGAGMSIEIETSPLEEVSAFSVVIVVVVEEAGVGSETGAACFWKE